MSLTHTVSLVFKAPHRIRTSLRSISILWAGTMTGASLAFATQVLLARMLGVEQLGAFSAALATVTLLAPLAGFGVAGYWLNAYGREGWQAQRWLPGSVRFITLSTIGVLVLLFAWAWLGPHDAIMAWLLSILSLHVFAPLAVGLTSAKYQLEGRHSHLARWQLTPQLLRFVIIGSLALILGTTGLAATHAAVAFATVALLLFPFAALQVRSMVRNRFSLEGHGESPGKCLDATEPPRAFAIASVAWPFGLAGVFYLIYFQSDIILIKYLVGETAAGIYNVAFVVMAAVYLFPSVVYQKFLLPRLHRWAHHDMVKLHQVYRVGNLSMLGLGLLAMVLIWLLAPSLLPWLFGNAYGDAVALLMILAVAAPFRFIASSAGAVLTTREHMRLKVRLMGVAAVFNVLLNLVLIPEYGASGAAIATVVTEAILMIMFFLSVGRLFSADFGGTGDQHL